MEVTDLPKNISKSIRINSMVLRIIEDKGYTAQSFLDHCISQHIDISVNEKEDNGIVENK